MDTVMIVITTVSLFLTSLELNHLMELNLKDDKKMLCLHLM